MLEETFKKYCQEKGKKLGKIIFNRLDGVDIVKNDLIGATSHQSPGLSSLLMVKHVCLHIAEVLPS